MAESRYSEPTKEQLDKQTLTCVSCHHVFVSEGWAPRICCPNCGRVGYPDRSWNNLLSLEWECHQCGELNDGKVNFCEHCGTGLTSRCLHCESPVYSSTCTVCGFPQAPIVHRRKLHTKRQEWLPLIMGHVQEEQAQIEARSKPKVKHNPTYGVSEWRILTPESIEEEERKDPEQVVPARPSPVSRPGRPSTPPKVSTGQRLSGALFILIGAGVFISMFREDILAFLNTNAPTLVTDVETWWTGSALPFFNLLLSDVTLWWESTVQPGIDFIETSDPNDPVYIVLLCCVAGGIFLLFISLTLIPRFVRRLAP